MLSGARASHCEAGPERYQTPVASVPEQHEHHDARRRSAPGFPPCEASGPPDSAGNRAGPRARSAGRSPARGAACKARPGRRGRPGRRAARPRSRACRFGAGPLRRGPPGLSGGMSGVRTDPSSGWIVGVVVMDARGRSRPLVLPGGLALRLRGFAPDVCAPAHRGSPAASRSMSRLWQSVVSLWTWLVLVAVHRPLASAHGGGPPRHGAVRSGPLRRRLPVPPHRARHRHAQPALEVSHLRPHAGGSAATLRGRLQPRIVRRHPADQPSALGDEVALQGRAVPDTDHGVADVARRRHSGEARLRPERGRGDEPLPRSAGEPGVGDDLSPRAPAPPPPSCCRSRTAPFASRSMPAFRSCRSPCTERARRSASTTGGSAVPAPPCGCSSRSRPPASPRTELPALKARVRDMIVAARDELAAELRS